MHPCFISLSTNTPCYKQHYDKKVGYKDLKYLKETDLKNSQEFENSCPLLPTSNPHPPCRSS